MNEKLCNIFTLLGEKKKYREQIEKIGREGGGKCAWIGVANNPWFDYVSEIQETRHHAIVLVLFYTRVASFPVSG